MRLQNKCSHSYSASQTRGRRTPCLGTTLRHDSAIGEAIQSRGVDLPPVRYVSKACGSFLVYSTFHEPGPTILIHHWGLRGGHFLWWISGLGLLLPTFCIQLGQDNFWRPLHKHKQIIRFLQYSQSGIRHSNYSLAFASPLEASGTSKHKSWSAVNISTWWVVSTIKSSQPCSLH
jgi:hypothetical protein